ncbi:trimeric intracellular cation channel family protein [Natronoglycomyces albus]|uniref:Trimeric intracellular cation channel family protein n=1 Tax=Natronoglycomyces albus TaxID=2811108 RepID=A0A895XUL3_9ACTN|nr:trimeric intracellular cation channel family protein [Natronoglycomyces albus]
MVITIADLTGVAVFAASGATAAVTKRLDLFGVCVIGALTALGGGMIRDIVIGSTPPLFFADWRYPVTAMTVAVIVFWLHPAVNRMRISMLVLDAAGLALFTVIGTHKALDYGVPTLGACFIGVISGVGGGILRDVLTHEIPIVLQRDFYALASLGGAVIVVLGQHLDDDTGRMVIALGAAMSVFTVRLIALKYRWHAPKPRFHGGGENLYPGFVPLLNPRGFTEPFSGQASDLSSQCPVMRDRDTAKG